MLDLRVSPVDHLCRILVHELVLISCHSDQLVFLPHGLLIDTIESRADLVLLSIGRNCALSLFRVLDDTAFLMLAILFVISLKRDLLTEMLGTM